MVSKSHAFFPVIFTQFIKYKQFFVQHPSIKNSVHQLFFIFWGGRKLDEYFFLGRLLYISTSEWVLHTLFTGKNMCFLCFSNFKLHFEKRGRNKTKMEKMLLPNTGSDLYRENWIQLLYLKSGKIK